MFGKNRHDCLRADMVALNGNLIAQKAEFRERLDKLFAWAVRTGERLDSCEHAIAQLQDRLTNISNTVGELWSKVETLEEKLAARESFVIVSAANKGVGKLKAPSKDAKPKKLRK